MPNGISRRQWRVNWQFLTAWRPRSAEPTRKLFVFCSLFLDASSHLNKIVCPLVRWSVGRLVGNIFVPTHCKWAKIVKTDWKTIESGQNHSNYLPNLFQSSKLVEISFELSQNNQIRRIVVRTHLFLVASTRVRVFSDEPNFSERWARMS